MSRTDRDGKDRVKGGRGREEKPASATIKGRKYLVSAVIDR
jgi:hypothetical protein